MIEDVYGARLRLSADEEFLQLGLGVFPGFDHAEPSGSRERVIVDREAETAQW
jgi:hypothetical protein